MNRRLAVVPVLAVALFGLVACNNSTTGSATPTAVGGGAQPTTGAAAPTSTDGSGGSGGSALAALQPCDLVSSSELSKLQLTKTDSGTGSGARSCGWQKGVDENGLNGYSAGVDIRDSQGLKDVVTNGFTVTSTTIGSHQARQLKSTNSGDCIVAVGVSDSSRVDVVVSGGTDPDKACDVAGQLAQVVEPQLPSGS